MKEACSGASDDDEMVNKQELFKHTTLSNGNKSNDAKQKLISKDYVVNKASSRHAASSKESDGNDESEIIILKEEQNAKALKESRNFPQMLGRRSSRLQGKRPIFTEIVTTSDEEENLESDDDLPEKGTKRRKGKNLRFSKPSKDQAMTSTSNSSDLKPDLKASSKGGKSKKDVAASKVPKEFSSGSFVVIKSDFHSTTTPAIWRIDGKALLQKYVHFEQEGQILYKNTSTYSGWTLSNRDQYYPAEVEIKSQKRNETIVKFKKELIIANDSD